MSFAIHIFMADPFRKEPYVHFLGEVQNLFGEWALERSGQFDCNPRSSNIDDCWIRSSNLPLGENVRVNITVDRMTPATLWGFEYAWSIHFDSNAGRSALSLAIQLGGLLLAVQSFKFLCVIDQDGNIEGEPTEFRSGEAVREHVKVVLAKEFSGYVEALRQRGVINDEGYFVIPERGGRA